MDHSCTDRLSGCSLYEGKWGEEGQAARGPPLPRETHTLTRLDMAPRLGPLALEAVDTERGEKGGGKGVIEGRVRMFPTTNTEKKTRRPSRPSPPPRSLLRLSCRTEGGGCGRDVTTATGGGGGGGGGLNVKTSKNQVTNTTNSTHTSHRANDQHTISLTLTLTQIHTLYKRGHPPPHRA